MWIKSRVAETETMINLDAFMNVFFTEQKENEEKGLKGFFAIMGQVESNVNQPVYISENEEEVKAAYEKLKAAIVEDANFVSLLCD